MNQLRVIIDLDDYTAGLTGEIKANVQMVLNFILQLRELCCGKRTEATLHDGSNPIRCL